MRSVPASLRVREPLSITPSGRRRAIPILAGAILFVVLACSEAATSGESSPVAPDAASARPGADAADRIASWEGSRHRAEEFALPPGSMDWERGDVGRGSSLFALHCAVCHGADGKGQGPAAVALNPKPRDFTEGTFYIDANGNNVTGEVSDLARVILVGPGAFGGSEAMQGWSETLSVEDVRDLVAFVESLSAKRE